MWSQRPDNISLLDVKHAAFSSSALPEFLEAPAAFKKDIFTWKVKLQSLWKLCRRTHIPALICELQEQILKEKCDNFTKSNVKWWQSWHRNQTHTNGLISKYFNCTSTMHFPGQPGFSYIHFFLNEISEMQFKIQQYVTYVTDYLQKYENTEIILKKYMLSMQKLLQHLLIITCLTSY